MSISGRPSVVSPLPFPEDTVSTVSTVCIVSNAMLRDTDRRIVQQILQMMLTCAACRLIRGIPVHPETLAQYAGRIPAEPTQHVCCKYDRYALATARVWKRWAAENEWRGMIPALLEFMDRRELSPSEQIVRETLLEEAQHWFHCRVFGSFIALFECPEGTVVVSEDLQRVYSVVDIDTKLSARCVYRETHSLEAALQENSMEATAPFRKMLGYKVQMTLLPYKDKIITDGAIYQLQPVEVSALEKAVQVAIKAMANGTIITVLPKEPVVQDSNFHELDFVRRYA